MSGPCQFVALLFMSFPSSCATAARCGLTSAGTARWEKGGGSDCEPEGWGDRIIERKKMK